MTIISDLKIINELGGSLSANAIEDTVVITGIIDGLVDHLLDNQLQVYPNPAYDQLTVNLSNGSTADVIKILDLTGREVLNVEPASSHLKFPLHSLPGGAYLLVVEQDGRRAVRRIEILR